MVLPSMVKDVKSKEPSSGISTPQYTPKSFANQIQSNGTKSQKIEIATKSKQDSRYINNE